MNRCKKNTLWILCVDCAVDSYAEYTFNINFVNYETVQTIAQISSH